MKTLHPLRLVFCLSALIAWHPQETLAKATPGTMTPNTHYTLWGPFSYRLYVPAGARPTSYGPLPLVVAVHGCGQSGEDFAKLTQLNTLADRRGFAVVYPEQSRLRNLDGCWNWFLGVNQTRGMGELHQIASLVTLLQTEGVALKDAVYAVGLSSGAALVSNLYACYPDLFGAVGIHSGTAYGAARSMWTAKSVLEKGSPDTEERLAERALDCSGATKYLNGFRAMVIHGLDDKRLAPVNGKQALRQILIANDWLDDQKRNGTVGTLRADKKLAKGPGGLHYLHEVHESRRGIPVEGIWVEGMAHEWSGGPSGLANSNPNGPDATQLFVDFFLGPESKRPAGTAEVEGVESCAQRLTRDY